MSPLYLLVSCTLAFTGLPQLADCQDSFDFEDVAENKRNLYWRADINSNLDLLRIRDKAASLMRPSATSEYRMLGLRTFELMTNPALKMMKSGFPINAYGSAQLPVFFWWVRIQGSYCLEFEKNRSRDYCKIFLDKKTCAESFHVHMFNTLLLKVDWQALTASCSELTNPRCSWGKYLSFLDPYAIDYYAQIDIKIISQGWDDRSRISDNPRAYGPIYYAPYKEMNCYPIRDIDMLSALYIYNYCMYHKKKLKRMLQSMGRSGAIPMEARLCPNPCHGNPCSRVNFATGNCKTTGFFAGDFVCDCRYNYEFDQRSAKCRTLTMWCNGTFCNVNGTASCKVDAITGRPTCDCHAEFMGRKCDQPNNPCINRRHHPALVTGNEACGVSGSSGNICIPNIGTARYSCKCGARHTASGDHPYSNCYQQAAPCSNLVCLYGSCIQSLDRTKSACQCEQGFRGENCQHLKGLWSQWSQWSECSPACRHTVHDVTRKRRRDCLGDPVDCHGPETDFEVCDGAPACLDPLSPEADALRRMRAWWWSEFLPLALTVTAVTAFCLVAAKLLELLLGRLLMVAFERWQMRINPPNTMGLQMVVEDVADASTVE